MSRSESITYPPGEILKPLLGKTDYEYVILWMLNNNKFCEWSDFTTEISESTLSGYLKKLLKKDYINKPEKGKYIITPNGKDRFSELSYDKKAGKRRLKYPPKILMKRRNYDHWILWMVYNNYSCKWSDFKQEPLLINQSSLSNNLNSLLESGFIIRDNKEYIITPEGKTEYFSVLKQYDLDRQSILEQESKRIEEITEKTREFFSWHNIIDDELKFRYLDNKLKLNYSKVKATLKSEEDFNKILLYLSLNHPDQYPDYISPKDFASKYEIDITTLNYYLREIVEKEFFQIKFFKIEDEHGRAFYFQNNEPIEKILNAIVEKSITKFTYLNKFQQNPTIDIKILLENVLNQICGNLFNEKLKDSIKTFLPEYIKYLAYKIEAEKKLIDSEAKLEGFIWQNIFEEFQTFEPAATPMVLGEAEEYYYSLDKSILDIFDISYLSKLYFLKTNEVQQAYRLKSITLFEEILKALYQNKVSKARELYEKIDTKLDKLHQLIIKDILATAENNLNDSLKITSNIIEDFPNEFIGYLCESSTYFMMDNYEKSLEIVEKGLEVTPNVLLFCQKTQILIRKRQGEEFLSEIEHALENYPNNLSLLRIKYMFYLTNWNDKVNNPEIPLGVITSALKIQPQDKELLILKSMFYLMIDKYKEGKRFLVKEIDFNFFKKNPRIDTIVFFLLTFSYLARGKFDKALKTANQAIDIYPDHRISYITKALVLGYNLIFKFKFQEPNKNAFLDLIEKAIVLDPSNYNKIKYLILKTYTLNGLKEFDESIKTIDNAAALIPSLTWLYQMKVYFRISANRESEALEMLDEYTQKYPEIKKSLFTQKSFIYSEILHKYDEALEVINDMVELYPQDITVFNNKAIFLAHLMRREEAIETADHLISLNPNNGNSYDTYGEVLMILGDSENAIEKFDEALKLDSVGDFAFQTYLKLGLCYQDLEMYDKALESFEKGKLLAERMMPSTKVLYLHEAEKFISEVITLKNKSKKNSNTT